MRNQRQGDRSTKNLHTPVITPVETTVAAVIPTRGPNVINGDFQLSHITHSVTLASTAINLEKRIKNGMQDQRKRRQNSTHR